MLCKSSGSAICPSCMATICPVGILLALGIILLFFVCVLDTMPPIRNKGIRSQWTNTQLELAINAIRNGMSTNAASNRYNISRRTLKRYFEKNVDQKLKMGRKTVLDNEQEEELSRRIVRLAQVGYPLTNKILKKCVFTFCEENRLSHPFSKEKKMAGRYWIKGFLQRHQEISIRKAQSMNPARAQKLNKFIVKDYFEKLKTVLQELDLMDKPERIYNVDEKGCRLTLHHQQTVLAKKGAKRVHLVAPEHGENVTIVACASANGCAIPPTILFKGQRMKPEWKDNLPHGSLALMTPKGSMNVETFVIWLEHLAKYKLEGKCLLIFDGASCHLDHSIVDVADKHNITLLCLPSNTTHELQPMDKSVFRSYEHHWDEQVMLFWTKYKDRALTKQRFGDIFSIVWDKAMTPANIKSGFSATGIFPYNPDAIPEVAFAPSMFTEDIHNENRTNTQSKDTRQKTNTQSMDTEQKTPSPQPSCSYKSVSEPRHQNILFYKKKRTRKESSSSESTGDYTSESDDSGGEIDFNNDVDDNTNFCKGPNEENGAASTSNTRTKNNSPVENKENVPVDIITADPTEECNPEEQQTDEKKTQNTSFTEMLETPAKIEKATKNRKKAINSRALIVKKNVFSSSGNKELNKKCAKKMYPVSMQKKVKKGTKKKNGFAKFVLKTK